MKNKNTTIISIIAKVSFFVAIFIAMLLYSQWREQKITEAAENYEKCILKQYKVEPYQWFQTHGEMPECLLNK
jgi:hypothetical protein